MKRKINTKFYTYTQNNSGGSFDLNDNSGIGVYVIIEAMDAAHANSKAEEIGLYFDGVQDWRDCPCCGDRWDEVDESDANDIPMIYSEPAEEFAGYREDLAYIHYLDGSKKKIETKVKAFS